MKSVLIYFFITIVPLKLLAQTNLVPNPSFENITLCPTGNGGNIDFAFPWFRPWINLNSSDLFNICDTIDSWFSVPENYWGVQSPSSGNGYSGIGLLGPGAPITNYSTREYIEIELLDSLRFGKVYNVNFYSSLADSSQFACNNIGLHFSDTIIKYNVSSSNLYHVPVHIQSSSIVNDTLNWVQVIGKYTAHGGEKFMIVGNFRPDSLTIFQTTGFGSHPWAYYYFDDFNVSLDTTSSIDELDVGDISISPNPSADEFTISTKNGLLVNGSLSVSNLQGQQVISAEILSEKQFTIDLKNFANGVYLLKMQKKEGIVIRKLVKM